MLSEQNLRTQTPFSCDYGKHVYFLESIGHSSAMKITKGINNKLNIKVGTHCISLEDS